MIAIGALRGIGSETTSSGVEGMRTARLSRGRSHEVASTRGVVVPPWIAPASLLVLATVFGGLTAQATWQDAVVQLASLPLLGWLLSQAGPWPRDRPTRLALVLLCSLLALPFLQLLPLPPALWTRLPGRGPIMIEFVAAQIALPWLPISLSPMRTWQGLLALLPAVTLFLAVLRLDLRSRRALTIVLICVGFASVILGLAQLATGPDSPFRFYGEGNVARGFFINRNHYAALLYVMVPFTAAWAIGLSADRRPEIIVGTALCLLVFVSLLLGLGMAQSRAGAAIAVVAGLASFGLTRTGGGPERSRGRWQLLSSATLVGVLLVLQFAAIGLLQRMEVDPIEDARWQFVKVTWRAIRDFLPFGSGFGTFADLYKAYESVEQLTPAYVNNAHNDYVEAALEGGGPAIALVAGFLIWFFWNGISLWRISGPKAASAIDLTLARAAAIAIFLLLLHSFVDYPIRSIALSTIFAIFCALMLPVWRRVASLGDGEPAAAGNLRSGRDGRKRGNSKNTRTPKRRSRSKASSFSMQRGVSGDLEQAALLPPEAHGNRMFWVVNGEATG